MIEEFFDYLRDFHFTGSIYAVKEGTPVFPNEPLITIRAKFIEAQLIETLLLVTVNHQSLIATKANRIVREAKGRPVLEIWGQGELKAMIVLHMELELLILVELPGQLQFLRDDV